MINCNENLHKIFSLYILIEVEINDKLYYNDNLLYNRYVSSKI
jgi:hypothetical protein